MGSSLGHCTLLKNGVNFVNQKKLWSEMYARLLSVVVTDYGGLVSIKNHKT